MKSFFNLLEAITRTRRLKISAGRANTELNKVNTEIGSKPGFLRSYRKNEELKTRQNELEQKRETLISAVKTSEAKSDRSLDRRAARGVDVSAFANREKRKQGLQQSLDAHHDAIATEPNQERRQIIAKKIANIHRNLGGMD